MIDFTKQLQREINRKIDKIQRSDKNPIKKASEASHVLGEGLQKLKTIEEMSETNVLEGKGIAAIYKQLDDLHTVIKKLKEVNCKRLSNDNYLSDKELSNLLKVRRRCFQQYRSAGIIPYYQICGKVLYRESDIEELLMKSYKSAFGTTKDSIII